MVVRYQYVHFLYLTISFLIITKVNKFQYKDPVNTKVAVQLCCIFLHLLKAQPRQSQKHSSKNPRYTQQINAYV
jgi:hypothetical protein